MEYMTEQFDLDMRKASLYSKNAYIEYEFAVEEAFLESPEYVEYVVTEAAGNLIEKVRAVFKKIIESVKKFFSGLIEKVKSFFSNNKEEKLKKAVQANPTLAKQKVEVPNLKEIEDVCGKRAMLRKKMIAEYKAGKLTRDRFDEMVEQNEKLTKRLKTVGAVAAAIGTIAAGVFAASKIIPKLKNSSKVTIEQVETIENEAKKQVIETAKQTKDKINHSDPLNQKSYKNSDEYINKHQKKDDDIVSKTNEALPKPSLKEQLMAIRSNSDLVSGNEVAQTVVKSITEEERATLTAQLDSINTAINVAEKEYKNLDKEIEGRKQHLKKIYDKVDTMNPMASLKNDDITPEQKRNLLKHIIKLDGAESQQYSKNMELMLLKDRKKDIEDKLK